MKVTIDWLKDFVQFELTPDALAEDLTLAGLEVDSVESLGTGADGVVIAEILEKLPHPDADRLSICRVTDGAVEHEIVCGAPNAAAGIRVPFAPVGTILPGGLKIKAAKIRGVSSKGMLCSAKELGLAEDADGLMVLGDAAVPGQLINDFLKLDDYIIDIDLTPNRGDCFSVLGVAREIAVRQGAEPLEEAIDCLEPESDEGHEIELIDSDACPRFAGRVVSGLDTTARSPVWLAERLRRVGLRPIHPVVDVTNYVMLELGQPLHAYRLDKLSGAIQVRYAQAGESLTLLDESVHALDTETLVIADDSGAIGMAGIMGGLSTSVDADTDSIFFESAFFSQRALQGRARRYGLHTDASVRFERGVDPAGQERAIERATALLLEISGGKAGPLLVAEDEQALPVRHPVALRHARVRQVLGIDIAAAEIERIMSLLGMQLEASDSGWQVTPPAYRFDIAIEADLIEEIGRTVGYDQIPVQAGQAAVRLGSVPERRVGVDAIADLLVARGYAETVSYGFTEEKYQQQLTGTDEPVRLANPLSQDLGVMRESLWPGLIRAARHNLSHQAARCRFFETGTVFNAAGAAVDERQHVAGLVTGSRFPVHWDQQSAATDFYDLKADVEALLSLWRRDGSIEFKAATHPALAPSRSAMIVYANEPIGWIGELHPAHQSSLGLKQPVVLFAIDLSMVGDASLPKYASYSRYPSVRRDLAVVVAEATPVADLTKHVTNELGDALVRIEVFDVYQGPGVDSGRKSIGIGLILQDASRTLNDQETDEMIERIIRRLGQELGATIRN